MLVHSLPLKSRKRLTNDAMDTCAGLVPDGMDTYCHKYIGSTLDCVTWLLTVDFKELDL